MADSHLGFDLPLSPRVARRRRGHDFLANHERALQPALSGKVDIVVHGGDLFHRPKVPASLVFQGFHSLLAVADSGVPVFVVPGNHERSRIPHERLAAHPNLHIFRRPETRVVGVRGQRVALTGFPYERRHVRQRFRDLLLESGWHGEEAGARLLCIHHCVEGATVGPQNFTFRKAGDVIRCADLPSDFAAVLSGHIHRHQVLSRDLQGRPLRTPVLYPGSVERTAFAELGEEKGYLLVEIEPGERGGRLANHEFVPLPSRPMLIRELRPDMGADAPWTERALMASLHAAIVEAPGDAVLRVRIEGEVPKGVRPLLAAERIRALAPLEMNLDVVLSEDRRPRGGAGIGPQESRPPSLAQHSFAGSF